MSNLATTEEIIAETRAGHMVILVDDEDRENEGDLIIAADFANAEAVNFMAKHGRGLICLALERAQVERLGLPPMARHNAARHQTAFTISIEAREGISTGISAADRATTIAAASNPQALAQDIVSPGHIFPLEARDGGVLVRAGHTEAAVDLARLAGLNPAGVICEIMNDDGSMARLPDLLKFAAEHKLKIGSIADLIAYRRRSERLVARVAEGKISTQHAGDWHAITYAQTPHYAEHLALVKVPSPLGGGLGRGRSDAPSSPNNGPHPTSPLKGEELPTLVRMHALDVLQDVVGDHSQKKAHLLRESMRMIDEHGSGVVVLIREPRAHALSESLHQRSTPAPSKTLRDYGIGAQILLDLGVREMTLLTNTPKMIVGLEGYGLHIAGYLPIKEPT